MTSLAEMIQELERQQGILAEALAALRQLQSTARLRAGSGTGKRPYTRKVVAAVTEIAPLGVNPKTGKPYKISPAARKRMAAGQKKRYKEEKK